MLKNFFITTFRNLKRNKVYALLNVFGLALGIGCALVIFKVVTYELSYDKFQSNYDQIYRVVQADIYPDGIKYGMGVPHPLGVAIREDIPEVAVIARTHYVSGDQVNVRDENGNLSKFNIDKGIAYTDPEVLDVFDFQVIQGNGKSILKEPNMAIVSEKIAKLLFGDLAYSQVIGKQFNLGNQADLTIGAIMKDAPTNTDIPFSIMMSYDTQKQSNLYYGDGTSWNSTSSSTNNYLILKDPSQVTLVNDKLEELEVKYEGKKEAAEIDFYLQPLKELHFDKKFDTYNDRTISKSILMALAVIGLFLVITACINFINLATAQAVKRSKEIGIRKAIGVSKEQLIAQFMSETFLITLISVVIALAIGELLLRNLEDVFGYKLSIDLFGQPELMLFLIGLIIFVSLLSGFYPSFLLSRLNAITALKSKISGMKHSGGISIRRTLVILQFSISQILIIATLVVGAQMDYFSSKDLGFTRDAVVTSILPDSKPEKIKLFRNKLLESSLIKDVTYSLAPPKGNSDSFSNFNNARTGSKDDFIANFKAVDHRYIDFFELELLAGRKFLPTDTMNYGIINRKVFDLLGLDHPEDALGLVMTSGFRTPKKIIGVIENFHSNSLHEKIDYVFLVHDPEFFFEVSFKLNTGDNGFTDMKSAIAHFEKSWELVFPEYLVDYTFLNDQLAEAYEDEKRISSLFQLFAAIAIFIGCLGLYGLISFIATQRVKEIGVRKVLGASVWSIINIFSKELILLLIVAFIIAAPLSYYFLDSWLSSFEYSISLGVTYFVVSLIASLIVALFTVGYKTYFTAIINPSISLKDE